MQTIHSREQLLGVSGIYRITLMGTNRHYIGQARNLWKRLRSHCNEARCKYAKRTKTKISYALEKYGVDAFKFTVLAFCDIGNLDDLEAHFIARFNGCEGFNIQERASGERDRSSPDEVREKISKANTGKKRSHETIKRMRQAALNKPPRTEESKRKQSASLKGRKLSEEHKQKLSDSMTGKKLPEHWRESLRRGAAKRGIPAIQFSPDGKLIATYKSVSDAARATGSSAGNLIAALKGRLKTCGGFIWQYAPSYAN